RAAITMAAISSASAAAIPQARITFSSSHGFVIFVFFVAGFLFETRATEAVLVPAAKADARLLADPHLHAPAPRDRCAALEFVSAGFAGRRIFPAKRDVSKGASKRQHL